MPGQTEFSLDTVMRFFADEKSIEAVNRSISRIKSYAKTALGAIGVGISLRELNRMTEEYRSIRDSMKSVFGDTEDLQAVQEKIKDTARDVRGEYDKIAQNVTDLVKNNRRVFDIETANRFTDIMYKLTKMSGGDNSQASAAVSSLSSAMKNGKIDRGAIDQLINNVPQAIKVLTSYYGVSQERLRSMAQAGLIRSAQIWDAFLKAGTDIDEAFKDVQLNVTDVISSFRSEFREFIGETDEMLGVSKAIAKILQQIFDTAMKGLQKARSGLLWLSDKLGGMENTLKLLAYIAGAFFVAFHFKEIVGGLRDILGLFSAIGIKGMALVAVITLIALLIDDFVHFMKGDKKSFFGDLFDAKGIDADGVRKKVFGAIEQIAKDAKAVWKEVQYAVEQLGLIIEAVFSGIKTWWENGGGDGVAESVKVFKDAIIDAWQAIKDWWDANGETTLETLKKFGESIGEAFEGALGVISSLFSLIVHILSGDEEKSEEDLQRIVEQFGLFLTGILDAIFGKGFTDDALKLGKSWIENFKAGLEEGYESVKEFLAAVPNKIKKAFGLPVDEVNNDIDEIDREIAERRKIQNPTTPEELKKSIEAVAPTKDDRTWVEKLLDLTRGDREAVQETLDRKTITAIWRNMSEANQMLLLKNTPRDDPMRGFLDTLAKKYQGAPSNAVEIYQTFNGIDDKNVGYKVTEADKQMIDMLGRSLVYSH